MKKTKKSTSQKMGFFGALTMLVGTVVGIGIFFKNNSISKATQGDGLTWLLAWIIGGLIAGGMAISFSEIGSMKTEDEIVQGVPAWTKKILGKKMGEFTKFNYSFFYFSTLTIVLNVFFAEVIIQPFIAAGLIKQIPIYGHALIALFLTFSLMALNWISIKTSANIQKITTIIKFIPLIFTLLIGIILANKNNAGGINAFTLNAFTLKGLIVALPAVLFSYDAFMVVTTMGDKMEDGGKKIPKVILIGMFFTIVLYTLIAISSILHNSGTISSIIDNVLSKGIASSLNTVMFVFIAISALGVSNGVSAGSISLFQQNTKDKTFFGMKKLSKKISDDKITIIYLVGTVLFWFFLISIPSMIINQDYLYDGITNFPTLFFFCIYSVLIFKYTIQRSKYKTKKINKFIFIAGAMMASLGIMFVVSYLILDHYIIESIKDINGVSSWGLFASTKTTTIKIELIVFTTEIIIFTSFPLINKLMKNKIEK